MSGGPVRVVPDGVRVAARVTPKASRNAVAGLRPTAEGTMAVLVQVTAAPEDGRANEAVTKLLAKEWGVPRTAVAVVAGATDRNKILHVAGDPAELAGRIEARLGAIGSRRTDRGRDD
ncbi:DUF167 family protein [Arenibaculum sp.]|uniref:DUF167 domain-containing protein n=1 Tax=Arenibaculum sp. TaxID=2865862 RepID=UPI002E1682A2|nr:DUF167 family protein [Arenibaculum sp.]